MAGGRSLTSATDRRRAEEGAPGLEQFIQRGSRTLGLIGCSILFAYSIAVSFGTVAALLMRRCLDVPAMTIALALCASPAAVVASLVHHRFGGHLLSAALVLATTLFPPVVAQQAAALAKTLSSDYVRAAIARGSSFSNASLVHGLRNSVLPRVTLATLEGPTVLGSAFVVEHVFGLHGLGEMTTVAVRSRDHDWLMALSISGSLLGTACALANDVASAAIDRSLSLASLRRRRS